MSPKEISELHRIALVNTGDKQQARRCVEAYLAGADTFAATQSYNHYDLGSRGRLRRI